MSPFEATQVASTSDRLFFECNPDRHFRVRPAFENESPMPSEMSEWQHYVVVRQIAPGLRVRAGFYATTLVRDSEASGQAMYAQIAGDVA